MRTLFHKRYNFNKFCEFSLIIPSKIPTTNLFYIIVFNDYDNVTTKNFLQNTGYTTLIFYGYLKFYHNKSVTEHYNLAL